MADVITRFKLETTQYDSKLRDAAKGLADYARQASFAGSEFDKFTKNNADAARTLGSISTSATNAKDKVKELVAAYNQAANAYNALTKEQQQSDWGKALAESINTLKGRITEAKRELYSLGDAVKNGKFGQFGGIIDGVGHKIGITGNLTEMLTSKTALLTGAIGAGTTAVVAATKAWADYNSEIAKQQQITTVTTGLKGDDADRMTAAARALSKTYNTDFRESINAANTLMSQFGSTGDEAIQLLRDGMRGMIQGDGGKLLSMIQQYAPAFRDAGVSASQLVAVIQNSEGGIFTDQNMNAIVFGIKNIRLMTKQTSEALAQLGIDGEAMTKKLNDGSMTIFDALKKVAGQLKNVDSNSQAAGQVMQAVFGRQGAMAGTNLAKAIETLNLNLEETKRQTGEVGRAYDDLYEANVRLEQALQKTFGYKGWEEMATGIKTKVVGAMADVLECIDKINTALDTNVVADYFNGMFDMATKAMGPLGNVLRMLKGINKEQGGNDVGEGAKTGGLGGIVPQNILPEIVVNGTNRKNTKPTKQTGGNKTPKTEEQLNTEEINKLTQEYIHASEQRQAAIRDEIKVLQERNELIRALKDQAQGKGFDPTKMQEIKPVELSFVPKLEMPKMPDIAPLKKQIEDELKESAKQVDSATLKTILQDSIQNDINGMDFQFASLNDQIAKGINVPDEKWQAILDQYNKLREQIGLEPITIDFKTGGIDNVVKGAKDTASAMSSAASAISQVGSALSSIQNPAAKVAGIVAQAIATIAQSFAGALAADQTTKTNIWAFIGASAASMAAMVSAISQIHSATGYAQGGIVDGRGGGFVGGTAYSGDNVGNVRLDSGELVLNRAQQSNLASQLDGGSLKNLHLTATVKGENLRLVLNNNGRRTGRGEYVTTNFT